MTVHQKIDLEQLCADKGLRITEQRRVIARVLSESDDHPDVELLHERANKIDSGISIATISAMAAHGTKPHPKPITTT